MSSLPKTSVGLTMLYGTPKVDQRLLLLRFPPVVRQVGLGRGLRHADVDDSPYAGFLGAVEQRGGILHSLLEGRAAVRKADPVGVVERRCAAQAVNELIGLVEVEGKACTASPKGFGLSGWVVMVLTCSPFSSRWRVMYFPM